MSIGPARKPVAWLTRTPKTPPWTSAARTDAGNLLRSLQEGVSIGMPRSRPMPSVGARCRELRIPDVKTDWRIMYRIDADAIVVVDIFPKTTQKTPKSVIDLCKARLKAYDQP